MAEDVHQRAYFHSPIFLFYLLAYCIVAISAAKYQLSIERRELQACIAMAVICLTANKLLLSSKEELSIILRSMTIMILTIIWCVHSLECVLWICCEAEQLTRAGELI